MNIAANLENAATRTPQKAAIRFEGRTISFRELNRNCNCLANGLQNLGLHHGDRCLIILPNSIEIVVVYYALAKLGAIAVPVNFLFRRHELTHIIKDATPQAIIASADHLDELSGALDRVGVPEILLAVGIPVDSRFQRLDETFSDDDCFATYPAAAGDVLAIIYTSGTTGIPKGAMLTQYNLTEMARIAAELRGPLDADTVVLGVLPLFHIYGFNRSLNASIYLGLTIELFPHFDPERVIAVMEKERRTVLYAVPTMCTRLVNVPEVRLPKQNSLQYCVSGGASLPLEILKQFAERFGAAIYEGYGLTEAPVCVESPLGQPAKAGSIGKPIPYFSVRIIDAQGMEVKPGAVGELTIKGPGVTVGYLNQPDATQAAIRAGWLHTGDMARADDEGYLYIVDRKKDLIIRGGYNVYPREIEEVLYRIPEIMETAVFGVAHKDLGEEIAAVVVLKPGVKIEPDRIRSFVKERVAPYKYPRLIQIVDKPLPKSGSGKILKKKIKQSYRPQY